MTTKDIDKFFAESDEAANHKKKHTIGFHVMRVLLFVGAAVCAVVGMLLLNKSTTKQVVAETVANEVIRGESQCRVLLLMSYDDGHLSVPYERSGVLDYMKRSGVDVDVEYMDTKHNPVGSPAYADWTRTMATKVESHEPYSAIICADDDALTYVENNHGLLFNGIPVVFFAINDFDHAERACDLGYATGLIEVNNISATMQATTRLLPNATKFMAIYDDTSTGIGDRMQFEDALKLFPGFELQEVNASQLTRDELAATLSNVGSDTIVFQLSTFNDSDGNTYSLDESARFVSAACPQPVFRGSIGGVGEGICGSGFVDFRYQGEKAAELCVRILNGTKPSDIELVREGSQTYIFDASVMDRFGLDKGSIPVDAVLINENGISWQSIRPILLPLLLLILAVVFVLLFAYTGYARSLRDAREILASRNNLRYRLYHDILTDLPNRQALTQYLRNVKEGSIGSIVCVDINGFGDINDSYGHDCGDHVLITIGNRLGDVASKLLVRSAGDEFILVLDKPLTAEAEELRQIKSVFDNPVTYGDSHIDVDASFGIANWDESMDVDTIIQCADLAIRNAKGENDTEATVFYDEQMKLDMERKLEITRYLKQAIAEESPVVVFQPQVNTADKTVYGYEALVRLKDNAYYPDQFIPVAEMSGMVTEIDRIVTKKVVKQLADWRDEGRKLGVVSINYSAAQLRDETYCDFLDGLLRKYQIDPKYIKIEITESMMLGREDLAEELFRRLGKMGISLALDDFGTGYSSLYRMATTPVDFVKLDKSLVDTYMIPGKEDFIDHLTQLIHGIDKKIVVEGVETAEQFEICERLGCDIIQGYFFARPLPANEAADFDPRSIV